MHGEPRLVMLDGVQVETPLVGSMMLMENNDTPGVVGAVGTILGRHNVNIANFALGRNERRAVGVVTVDDSDGHALTNDVMDAIRAVPAIDRAWAVRV
jgi:D-3-phosphoglycerate dehydrogenase